MKEEKTATKHLTVSESDDGERLDHFIGAHVPELSRSQAKKLIVERLVTVNGRAAKPSTTLSSGDEVLVHVPAPREAVPAPEPIPLDVVYEDADLLVINKPAGIVVHPAPGSPDGTLVNAILHHCGDELAISGTKRPGIVHRLDKDTSGLLVVAKNDASHRSLAKQIKDRSAERIYLALVEDVPEESQGKIDAPIGRSIGDRKRMAVTGVRGRKAVTNFRVTERFTGAALLEVKLDTGRTHQVRVHMTFIGHPILGDAKYGGDRRAKDAFSEEVMVAINALKGQALHATALGFVHPSTGQRVRFEAPPPDDFTALLHILRKNA